MNELKVLNVSGIDCYEKDGIVYLKLEDVARGLGFTTVAKSGNECVRWARVEEYLASMGFPHLWGKNDFIPENVFYRLAMKANNEVAEAFQAKVADEVIPSIRKHGAYMTEDTLDRMITSPEFGIKLLTALKEEKDKRKALEVANSELSVQNAIMAPKADYFDDLVNRPAAGQPAGGGSGRKPASPARRSGGMVPRPAQGCRPAQRGCGRSNRAAAVLPVGAGARPHPLDPARGRRGLQSPGRRHLRVCPRFL